MVQRFYLDGLPKPRVVRSIRIGGTNHYNCLVIYLVIGHRVRPRLGCGLRTSTTVLPALSSLVTLMGIREERSLDILHGTSHTFIP